MNNTHNLKDFFTYPTHHIRVCSEKPLINVQSNVEINQGDMLITPEGESRTVKRIISKSPSNKVMIEGIQSTLYSDDACYYVIEMDTEILTKQREFVKGL